MSEPFQLEIITPEARYFTGFVEMVEVPGTLGDFGVLIGHAPFISTIRPGVITVHRNAQNIERIFVMGGLAEVNPAGCTILAEQAEDVSNITPAMVAERLAFAKKKADEAIGDQAKAAAEVQLRIAEAMGQALAA